MSNNKKCDLCDEPIYIFRKQLLKPASAFTDEATFDFRRIQNPQYCWACGKQLFEVEIQSKMEDKQIMDQNIEDSLLIGYDSSNDRDHMCLTICRKMNDNKIIIIKQCFDEEAKEIYNKLVTKEDK